MKFAATIVGTFVCALSLLGVVTAKLGDRELKGCGGNDIEYKFKLTGSDFCDEDDVPNCAGNKVMNIKMKTDGTASGNWKNTGNNDGDIQLLSYDVSCMEVAQVEVGDETETRILVGGYLDPIANAADVFMGDCVGKFAWTAAVIKEDGEAFYSADSYAECNDLYNDVTNQGLLEQLYAGNPDGIPSEADYYTCFTLMFVGNQIDFFFRATGGAVGFPFPAGATLAPKETAGILELTECD